MLQPDPPSHFGKHMLYITNNDKPGFIGNIGTLMGNAFSQLAALPLEFNQAFSHDRWLP